MITAAEALDLVFENVFPLRAERVSLSGACDRVLAADFVCREDLPSFDSSAMDGYALRFGDLGGGERSTLAAAGKTLRAGAGGVSLGPGEAARIMTGAPIPLGADTVVMQELVESAGDGLIRLSRPPKPGQHIRRRGEDAKAGRLLISKGTRLRPYDVALLAAQNAGTVEVVRRPRAAVVATGDELNGASPTAIPDANGPALTAALDRWGAAVSKPATAGDEPSLLKKTLAAALEGADLLLVTGGVSIGEFDFTKAVLGELGLKTVFWKVAIKPGKPLLFGLVGRTAVFGLPGNPVAALVCAEEFVRPALERLQGLEPSHDSYHLRGKAVNDYPKPEARQQYLFCRARRSAGGYELEIIRPQGSAMLAMASRANALAIGPLGASRVRPGEELAFRWLK